MPVGGVDGIEVIVRLGEGVRRADDEAGDQAREGVRRQAAQVAGRARYERVEVRADGARQRIDHLHVPRRQGDDERRNAHEDMQEAQDKLRLASWLAGRRRMRLTTKILDGGLPKPFYAK